MAKRNTKTPAKNGAKISPQLILVIIVLAVACILLITSQRQAATSCGDARCDSPESCSSCPSDCGDCAAACGDGSCGPGETSTCPQDCAGVASIPPSINIPVVPCNFSTNGDAYTKAMAEKNLEYCSCIDDTALKDSCKDTVEESAYFTNALNTFDIKLCEELSNPYAKESCIALVSSAVDQLVSEDPVYFIYLFANTQNYDEAIPLIEGLLAENPDNYGTWMALALIYSDKAWAELGQGEYTTKAMDAISKALELNPNSAAAYRIQGQVYKATGDVESAIESYDKSLSIDPNLIDAYVGRGHAYRMRGEYLNALDDFNKAKELDANRTRIDIYLHMCVLMANNDEMINDAIDNCRIVTEFPPEVFPSEKAEAYSALGSIYMRGNRIAESLDSFRMSLTYQPNNPTTLSAIAKLYNGVGNYTAAQESAEKAISVDPMKSTAQLDLAFALYKQNMTQKAIEAALKGLELVDTDPSLLMPQKDPIKRDLYYVLASIYRDMGDTSNEVKYRDLADAYYDL